MLSLIPFEGSSAIGSILDSGLAFRSPGSWPVCKGRSYVEPAVKPIPKLPDAVRKLHACLGDRALWSFKIQCDQSVRCILSILPC